MPPAKKLIGLLVLLFLTQIPASAESIRILYGQDNPSSLKLKANEYFKRLVEQRSNNRLVLKLTTLSPQPGDPKILDQLESGALQMAAPGIAELYDFNAELQIFELPFLFRDEKHLHRVMDGEVGRKLLSRSSRRGLVALAFWDEGFKQFTSNRPLKQPEQLAQLSLNVLGSKVLSEQLQLMGAVPRTISTEQLFQALQNGILEGEENTFVGIEDQKLHLVQSDLLASKHGYRGYVLLANARFWSQVPEDLKVIMQGAIDDTTYYTRDMALQLNRAAQQNIQATSRIRVQELTGRQRTRWEEIAQEFYPRAYDRISKELIIKTLNQR